jgi:hypothetical protein
MLIIGDTLFYSKMKSPEVESLPEMMFFIRFTKSDNHGLIVGLFLPDRNMVITAVPLLAPFR